MDCLCVSSSKVTYSVCGWTCYLNCYLIDVSRYYGSLFSAWRRCQCIPEICQKLLEDIFVLINFPFFSILAGSKLFWPGDYVMSSGLTWLSPLKRTAHFLHQRNPADTEACLYELHQELLKTWRFSKAYSNYFTQICNASQFNGYLHSRLLMVCQTSYCRPWKCHGCILSGPTRPSLSIFNKHLGFSFSQNEHNVY